MKHSAPLRPVVPRALAAALLLSAGSSSFLPPSAAAAPDIRVEPLSISMNSPAAKTIYLEIDWMETAGHSHRPSQAALDRMADVFAAAGYQVVFDLSDAIPHQDVLAVSNRPSSSPAVTQIVNAYFDHAGDSRWYYSLWAHNYSYNGAATTSSGIADQPGRVHLVTLGSFANQVGTFANQAGTLVHEFGHNLGQRHGGSDEENWKPNYLSIMNYFYQLQGIGPALRSMRFADSTAGIEDFGYSHGLLPLLNESALDERAGIGLGRPVDWDCDGVIEASVAKDIQSGNWCAAPGGRSTLGDFDNWSDLAGKIATFGEQPFGEPESLGEPELLAGNRSQPCVTREEHDLFLAQAASFGEPLPAEEERDSAAELSVGEPSPAAGAASFTIANDGSSDLGVTSLSLDTAAPWIRWAPDAPFTVAPGRSQRVYLTVDWDQVPAGLSQRRLLVGSNDADENPYPGGIALRVQGRAGSCTLTTASSPAAGGSTSGATTAACGSSVTVRATAAAGYVFTRWLDGAATASTQATYGFTLNGSRQLVAEFTASGGSGTALSRGVAKRDTIAGSSSQGSWKYYYVDVEPGSRHLLAMLYDLPAAGPQNLDLYLRHGGLPTLANWDCRPYAAGAASEECNFAAPAAGRWYIGINNRDLGAIPYTVGANWQSSSAEIFADGFENGSTAAWR